MRLRSVVRVMPRRSDARTRLPRSSRSTRSIISRSSRSNTGSAPSDGQLPDRPINVPIYMAGQGPKARALAKEIADGLISLGGPAEGFETGLVSTNGTVLDDGEDVTSPRASKS